jgi:hypothetical protein
MEDRELQIRVEGNLLRMARLDAELYQFASNPEPLIERLRASGERIDIFTFLQGLPEGAPRHRFHMEWDNLAVLNVSTFENWWNNQIRSTVRNRAKQAVKKGIVVREVAFDEDLVRGIWGIFNESPVRQGRRFRHYGKDMRTVHQLVATYLESSTFIGAYRGDELIGFIKMVADQTGVQAGLMNIISKVQYKDRAPTNALLAQAVKSCADRGIPYLDYDNFVYGKKLNDSLVNFKERNGFRRVNIPRYYIPLTPLGHAALHMGFQHRLVERVPEPIAKRLRELRRQWHGRGISSASGPFDEKDERLCPGLSV